MSILYSLSLLSSPGYCLFTRPLYSLIIYLQTESSKLNRELCTWSRPASNVLMIVIMIMNIVHYHAKAFYCFVLCFRSNNESENVLKRTKQCVIFSFKLTFQIFAIYHLQYKYTFDSLLLTFQKL